MNISELDAFKAAVQEAQKRRQISQMAEALVFSLQIQNGHGLVPLLGYPDAYNNAEAVAYWVMDHLDETSADSPKETLRQLAVMLNNKLNRLIDN